MGFPGFMLPQIYFFHSRRLYSSTWSRCRAYPILLHLLNPKLCKQDLKLKFIKLLRFPYNLLNGFLFGHWCSHNMFI